MADFNNCEKSTTVCHDAHFFSKEKISCDCKPGLERDTLTTCRHKGKLRLS